MTIISFKQKLNTLHSTHKSLLVKYFGSLRLKNIRGVMMRIDVIKIKIIKYNQYD
jgi:hypothetical protein